MNNYGPRVITNLLSGLLCSILWLRLFAPEVSWHMAAWRWGLAAWAIALLYVVSYGIPMLRRRLNLPVLLPIASLLLLLDLYWFGPGANRQAISAAVHGGLIPAMLLAGPLVVNSLVTHIKFNPWVRENFFHGDGDNATWATRSQYHDREIEIPRDDAGHLGWTDRILLGATIFRHDIVPRLVGIKTGVHLCTFGMTSSGKSATSQWPNFAMYRGAGLIVDMKGEHARMTGKRRSELGPVSVFDPLDVTELPSATCNVLVGIDPTTDEGLQQIAEIRKAIVLPEKNAASGPHFADNSGTLLEGVITWVCLTQPPETRNLATVYRIINSTDPATGVYDGNIWVETIDEMSRCPYGQCIAAAKLIIDTAQEEAGSFMSTLSKSLKWMASSGMQQFLSGEENPLLGLHSTGKKRPTIYIVVGIGNEKDYTRYIRLMVSMGIYYLRREHRRTLQKPQPSVLVSLDEYPLYAEGLDSISSGFGNLREAGCMLWVCAQKISQVRDAIGEGFSLLLQSSTVQVFGINNDNADVAAWVSDQLGKHTLKKKEGWGLFAKTLSEKAEPLMTRKQVEDTLRQHAANQIVFPADGGSPMWLHRRAYKRFRIDGKQYFEPLDLEDVFGEWRDLTAVQNQLQSREPQYQEQE